MRERPEGWGQAPVTVRRRLRSTTSMKTFAAPGDTGAAAPNPPKSDGAAAPTRRPCAGLVDGCQTGEVRRGGQRVGKPCSLHTTAVAIQIIALVRKVEFMLHCSNR